MSLNKATLMGRLVKDPELKYTTNNNYPYCSFTLAVSRKFAKQGEEKQVDFIPIVAWNKSAEFCAKYFKKGQNVVVVGRIQVRNWKDTEGKTHYVTEVVTEETYFAESKKDDVDQSNQTAQVQKPNNITQQPKTPVSNNNSSDGFFPMDADDELPF